MHFEENTFFQLKIQQSTIQQKILNNRKNEKCAYTTHFKFFNFRQKIESFAADRSLSQRNSSVIIAYNYSSTETWCQNYQPSKLIARVLDPTSVILTVLAPFHSEFIYLQHREPVNATSCHCSIRSKAPDIKTQQSHIFASMASSQFHQLRSKSTSSSKEIWRRELQDYRQHHWERHFRLRTYNFVLSSELINFFDDEISQQQDFEHGQR